MPRILKNLFWIDLLSIPQDFAEELCRKDARDGLPGHCAVT